MSTLNNKNSRDNNNVISEKAITARLELSAFANCTKDIDIVFVHSRVFGICTLFWYLRILDYRDSRSLAAFGGKSGLRSKYLTFSPT